jgi:hypothetical protein
MSSSKELNGVKTPSNIFNMKITNEQKIKQGKSMKDLRTFTITRKNEKDMNMANFKDVYGVFKKKYGVENLMVRALNDTQFFTFKGFTDSGLDIQDFEEYYQDRVANKEKFNMFSQVQI